MATAEDMARVEKTVRKALKQRNLARSMARYEIADEIRSALDDMGVDVVDTSGTTSTWQWKIKPVDDAPVVAAKKRPRPPEPAAEEAAEPAPAEAKPPSLKLRGGVRAKILTPGDGAEAKRLRTIHVKYAGVLAATGRKFDAGKIKFRLGAGDVIKGWDVGCLGMKVGEKRRLTIPPKMAYGARGAPPDIPKNATLVFDVTLLDA